MVWDCLLLGSLVYFLTLYFSNNVLTSLLNSLPLSQVKVIWLSGEYILSLSNAIFNGITTEDGFLFLSGKQKAYLLLTITLITHSY